MLLCGKEKQLTAHLDLCQILKKKCQIWIRQGVISHKPHNSISSIYCSKLSEITTMPDSIILIKSHVASFLWFKSLCFFGLCAIYSNWAKLFIWTLFLSFFFFEYLFPHTSTNLTRKKKHWKWENEHNQVSAIIFSQYKRMCVIHLCGLFTWNTI